MQPFFAYVKSRKKIETTLDISPPFGVYYGYMSNKTYIAYVLGYLIGFTLTWICTFYIWKWLYTTYKTHWLEARNKWWKFWYGFVCLFYVGWWFGVFDHLKWGGILITIFVSIKYFQYRSRESLTIEKKVINNISIRNKPQRQTEKKTQWVSKKNKIMHRIIQWVLILPFVIMITSYTRNYVISAPSYYLGKHHVNVMGEPIKGLYDRSPKYWPSSIELAFWDYVIEEQTRADGKPTLYVHIRLTDFRWCYFLTTVLVGMSVISFLVWTTRIRKITPEEKYFRKEIKDLETLKESNLLSSEENKNKRKKLIEKFIDKLKLNKKRPFDYKVIRLTNLKEENLISEEELKEAKKQLIEQGE